ncbi:MAG: FHA domain-containing protein [Planctomycetes bacterium]|nr:FHA domain-containing protein [Planctomycetota bacterium]
MSKPSYVLRLVRDGQPPQTFEFDQERISIGREVGDVAVHDPGASSKHAEIVFHDGIVQLRDIGSTNGTWLGTRKVEKETMAPGVKFTIGTSTLELVELRGLETAGGTLVMAPPQLPVGPSGTQVRAPGAGLAATEAPTRTAKTPRPRLTAQQRKVGAIAGAAVVIAVIGTMLFRGDGKRGNAAIKDPTEVTVRAVYFRGPQGPQASGGTTQSTVRISPNKKGGASVGVMEEFAGGAGNQWRTATWLAAFSASQLTGQSLTDYEFLVRTSGHIDGPSAGMLMTSTMIALLRGKKPRPDTTMTGTINPDGSAGPVGGIVQKMNGAAKDGIKRFGFPMGARNHQDMRDGRIVDLFDVGKELGLEVREIHDVFEAYEFLTDDKLERPAPVPEAAMELDSSTAGLLRSKNQKWTAIVEGEIAGLKTAARGMSQQLAQRVQPFAQAADEAFAKARGFEQSDFLTSAFDSYVQAAVAAGTTKSAAQFLKALAANDTDAMLNQVDEAAAVRGKLNAMLSETELRAKTQTGGGQINTLRAYQAAVIADAYRSQAEGADDTARRILKLQKDGKASQDQVDAIPDLLFEALRAYSVAKTMLEVAEDQRAFGNEEGQSPPIELAAIGRSAAAYGSAAGAVLQYLESLVVDSAAEEAGIDKQTAKNRLANNDTDYLLASRAVNIAEGLEGKAAETNMLRLAAGSMAFLKGASLVNKYYSLGGQRDQAGNLTLSNRKALSAQLDLARRLARESAAKAQRAVGFVPIAARLAYQLGVARREGNDEDKLSALEAYWESAFWSELAASSPTAR